MDRISKLERAVRRWQVATVGTMLASTAVLLAGFSADKPDTIRAKGFEVVDDEGRVLVSLTGSIGGGGEVRVLNSSGGKAAVLTTHDDGGWFYVCSPEGEQLAAVLYDRNGGRVRVYASDRGNDSGVAAVDIGVSDEGEGTVERTP